MANILDYLDWRGDLPFVISPFNKVDNLIISQLAYVKFNDIIPGLMSGDSISIKDAAELYMTRNPLNMLKKNDVELRGKYNLVKKLSESRRYMNARLSRHISILDEQNQKQFSALCVALGDNTIYIAFRGTDDTITGWKEDLNMSLAMPVPAQLEAVNYLNLIGSESNCKIRVGGHSKGGNLAVYAAMNCEDYIEDRIISIYNNDGPGFTLEIIESLKYQNILDKIITTVPEYSVFGLMFQHREDYMVVKSCESGIMQHDSMSWQVMGKDFEYVDKICNGSRVVSISLKNWINSLTDKERYNFVEVVYRVIKSSGCNSVSEFRSSKIKYAHAALKEYSSLDNETRDMALKALKILNKEYSKNILTNILPSTFTKKEQVN